MSDYSKKYNFWVTTKAQLENVMIKQKILSNVQPVDDRFTAHCVFAEMYLDYLELVNKLGYIYHRTFQVQKRELLTRLLQAAGTRLLEIRNEIKDIELSEFIYIERTLLQRKVSYELVQIIRPDFFPYARVKEIQDLIKQPRPKKLNSMTEEEKLLAKIAGKKGVDFKRLKVEKDLTPEQQAIRDAVILIQSLERLRKRRIWQTNIKYDSKKYTPSAESYLLRERYRFTHKSDQEMLLYMAKTEFSDQYFRKPDIRTNSFQFYTKRDNINIDELSQFGLDKKTSGDQINEQEEEDDEDDYDSDEDEEYRRHAESKKMSVAFYGNASGDIGRKLTITDLEAKKDFENQSSASFGDIGGRSRSKSIKLSTLIVQPEKKEPEERIASPHHEDRRIRRLKRNAARKIQRAWRTFLAIRNYKKLLEKRAILLGMASERKPFNCPLDDLFRRSYELKTIKDQYAVEFLKAVENEKTRILVKHSAGIMEDISDHIRYWLKSFYDITGDLPPFPAEAKGGTILVLQEKTITPSEFLYRKSKTPAQLKIEDKKIKQEQRNERKKERAKVKYIARKEKAFMVKIAKQGKVYYDFEKIFERNKSTKALENGLHEVNDKWYYDVDERTNYKEAPFMTWISEEKFAEVHEELRKVVDEMMRLEYEELRKAMAIDRKKKYKPPKPPRVKKPKKGKKKKVEPDLTQDLKTSQIFYEMQDVGLIRNYKKRCFEEFFGDFNYCAYHLKNYFGLEVKPSTLEVRDILREWIMGMGPLNLPKYKSILIGGPPKTGKYKLVEILASEMDAVMIDLSIEVIAKYQDDIQMLIHLVNKMSRILQPVVLYVHNIERSFWKKVPPQYQHLNPLLLSKILKKFILKPIKDVDKVILIATTDEPWNATKKMNKIFDKVLLMPQTDYSSAFIFWRKFILEKPGLPRDLEFSPLAWVCKNYNSGVISENIDKTLDIDRRMLLPQKSLKFEEFVETFIADNQLPAGEDAYKKYDKWFKQANKIAKKRNQVMKILRKKEKK